MSKFLSALLALAVLVWGAANAPGWSAGWKPKGADAHPAESAPETLPAYDPVLLAALGRTDEFDIDAWMERAQEEMNARWAAWNQFNAAEDFQYVAPERYSSFGRHGGGGASGDARLADSGVRFSGSFGGFDPAVSGSIAGIIPGFRGIAAGPSSSGGPGGKGHTPNGNAPGTDGNGPGTDPGTDNEPPPGNPPVTPPTDEDPHTTPPETNPPGTNPPGTNPPGTNPPETDPPGTNPPGTNPEHPDPWGPGKPGDGPDTPENPTVTVPEPGSMGLLGVGLVGMALARRRRSASRRG